MQLKQILREVHALKTEGTLDREITGVTYDSRRVTPGMIFVAVHGQSVDGHDFIHTAIDRGAAAIVFEKNGFPSHRAAKIKVADSREALARISAAFYEHPSKQLKMIGVTGTNGKTTVAFLIKQILEQSGISCGLLGTVRYEIGDRVIPAQRTTPESLDLQQMLAQMVRAHCTACVMEVSSHALEQKRVLGIDFDVTIFTNLTQDHLDYHKTMENYFSAKEKLFTEFHRKGAGSSSVINIDDRYGSKLAERSSAEVRITYGLNSPATLRAGRIQLGPERSSFRLETPEGEIDCNLPLIGRHNLYNGLAAVGAGMAMKLKVAAIGAALNRVRPVPGRLETVPCGQPFGVFIDYAHTDDALSNVLRTLREITPGRLLLAFGCGGNRDSGKRFKMGKVAAELADYTVITSDNPRKEPPESIAAQIEQGFQSVRPDGYRVELDRRRAIDEILRAARPGDNVIIAGKGHETYQEFEDTVIPFDDRLYAQETLETLGFQRCLAQ